MKNIFSFLLLTILLGCQPSFAAVKYLQGDSIKSADLLKSYTFSGTQGKLVTAESVSGDATMVTSGDLTNFQIKTGALVSGDLSTSAGLVSSQIADGTIVSADLSTSAGIVSSQIADGTIVSADLSSSLTLVTPTVSGDLTLSGGGIKFPATQVSSANANTLDDYEEGTFSGTITGRTVAGTPSLNLQTCYYVKIGRLVYWTVHLNLNGHAGGSGDMQISGLPFTSKGTTDYYNAGYIGIVDNLATTAGTIPTLYGLNGEAAAVFRTLPTGGGGTANIALDSAFYIVASGFYVTD